LLIAILIVAFKTPAIFQHFAVSNNGRREEFTPDIMVISAAALLLPTRIGALAIPCGFALGVALRRELTFAHLDDSTHIIVASFLALTLAHLVGAPGLGLNSIAGAALAGGTLDALSLLMLAISLALAKQTKFWAFFRGGLTSVVLWPWMICLGILVGIIGWDAPWALPLMAAPLALIFMASRSRVEATEDRTRLDGLLKATTDILAANTVASVTAAVASSIAPLFESQEGRIDVDEPGEGELGVTLKSECLGGRYLIVPARVALVRSYTEHDRLLLETLASVTAFGAGQSRAARRCHRTGHA